MRSRGIFAEISVTVRLGVGVLNAVWDDEWISVPMENLHLKQISVFVANKWRKIHSSAVCLEANIKLYLDQIN